MPYVIAQMFPLSIVTLKPMLLHSCPLLFASGIHFLKISETRSEFKSKLYTKSKKPQLLYNVGSRQHQVNHARLRLGFSSLNYDLHRRNIIPSPHVLAVPFKSYRIILPSVQYINQCVIVIFTIYLVYLL